MTSHICRRNRQTGSRGRSPGSFASRRWPAPLVRVVREADRDLVAEVAKRHEISDRTIYIWRKRFGALGSQEARRLRDLEAENARPKRLVAERDLEIEVMTAA